MAARSLATPPARPAVAGRRGAPASALSRPLSRHSAAATELTPSRCVHSLSGTGSIDSGPVDSVRVVTRWSASLRVSTVVWLLHTEHRESVVRTNGSRDRGSRECVGLCCETLDERPRLSPARPSNRSTDYPRIWDLLSDPRRPPGRGRSTRHGSVEGCLLAHRDRSDTVSAVACDR